MERRYTPDHNTAGLAALAKRVQELRHDLLSGEEVDDDTCYPAAELHLLTAISLLEQAKCALLLAKRCQGLGD